VKLLVPDAVGVPPMLQLLVSESPAGRAPPASVHEYGAVPPLTTHVALYASPTSPVGVVH
jgi:hypothetical protein